MEAYVTHISALVLAASEVIPSRTMRALCTYLSRTPAVPEVLGPVVRQVVGNVEVLPTALGATVGFAPLYTTMSDVLTSLDKARVPDAVELIVPQHVDETLGPVLGLRLGPRQMNLAACDPGIVRR